ncbi:hypothetical protein [Streptomyces sp. NPDC049040]|uniref:hypothetical protein n=1 Tax=Streptomyces sp. NPDC049040 TaxID=3365593 RepID=UPI0037162E32
MAERVVAPTDRTTRIATLRRAPARAVRKAVLPWPARVPSPRRGAVTDRMTGIAAVRRRPARAVRKAVLPWPARVPAVRTRLVREPAEPGHR